MQLFGLKTCDTCRKAAKALNVVMRDVRADPLDPADITRFLAAFGTDLVNKRSTTWRNLDDAERANSPETLLADHPTLMKRPVIEKDGQLYLGWGAAVQNALL